MTTFANSDAFNDPRPKRRRSNDWGKLVLFLVAAGCAIYIAQMVFHPWAFYFGGHRHALPIWQGTGTLHAPAAGGDYSLYVYLYPTGRGRTYLNSSLSGNATLCTPRGELFRLTLSGSMPRNPGTQLIGTPISLYIRSARPSRNVTGDYRPRLNFKGTWGDRALLLDDAAALAAAFNADGTLRAKALGVPTSNVPPPPPTTPPIPLHEVSGWWFQPSCPAFTKGAVLQP